MLPEGGGNGLKGTIAGEQVIAVQPSQDLTRSGGKSSIQGVCLAIIRTGLPGKGKTAALPRAIT